MCWHRQPSATAVRNLINQFELPFLFYIVCVILYMVNGVNDAIVALAWLFVASRFVHSWVHVSSNDLRKRRPLFLVGFVVNAILWLWLVWVLLRV